MAVLDSIAIEIQVTIAGVLILLFITLLEILDLRRALRQHRETLQTLSPNTALTQKKSLISPFNLILQFIFGFSAFALFAIWMMYLIIRGMPILAAIAGGSAFIAAIMPFIAWSACRKAGRETAEAIQKAERQRQQPTRPTTPEPPITQSTPLASAEEAVHETKTPAPAQTIIPEPEQGAQPRPVANPQPATLAQANPASNPKPDPMHVFPQDSMLRRHFITHLAATAKSCELSRPTDSMLRRHYDTMLANQTSESLLRPGKTPAPAKLAARSMRTVRLPEDSMLRRHFLAALQAKIESNLPLSARPTDSMLRRHYDAMKESLVGAELKKYLEG